jgi:phosphopantetheinyl transferase (holo-ACP synthase)
MADALAPAGRCGIDSVEVARIERLLAETPAEDLAKIFSDVELEESGAGPGRAASLAARFAAKEACVKLFPAKPRWARSSLPIFRSRATTTARRESFAGRVPRRCSAAIGSRRSRCR